MLALGLGLLGLLALGLWGTVSRDLSMRSRAEREYVESMIRIDQRNDEGTER